MDETKKVLEDLLLHQAELQAQNDELRTTREDLETQRHSLADLYDNAPVAYLSLDTKGVIKTGESHGIDITGHACAKTHRYAVSTLCSPGAPGQYSRYLSRVARGSKKISCELRLRKHGGNFFWGRLESVSVESLRAKKPPSVSAVIDITERKEMVEDAAAKRREVPGTGRKHARHSHPPR